MAVNRPNVVGLWFVYLSIRKDLIKFVKAVKSLSPVWQNPPSPIFLEKQLRVCYFLNMSCRGPGRNLRTVSRMLSSSSSSSAPQPAGMAFLGRVREPSHACSIAAFSSASFSSFFFSPYYINIHKIWSCD